MTRVDPNDFANSYLAGARLGTQQFQMVDEMQQRAMQQQREQEQLMRTRQILKGVLQQAAAPALAVPQPPGGMGPPMQNAPDSGGFGTSIQQNNKDIDELSNMIDVASPDSLKFIAGLVEDRRKMSQALADARHAWERGIVNHLDDQAHPEFAAFARDWAAENNPERKMQRWDNFQKQQAENQKAMQQNEEWNRRQETLQMGREALQQGSQAFTASRDSAKAKASEAEIRQLAADMSAQFKIPMEEALRRVRLTKGNVINEGQNQTAGTRQTVDSLIKQRDQLVKMSKDGDLPTAFGERPDVKARIAALDEQIGELMVGPRPTRPGWYHVTSAPGAGGTEHVFGGPNGAREYVKDDDIPEDLRGLIGGHGFAQTTSTPPAPGAPTQASPVADDATVAQVIKALTAQLGREPTDDEIDAAMEGV